MAKATETSTGAAAADQTPDTPGNGDAAPTGGNARKTRSRRSTAGSAPPKGRTMSAEHKAALEIGRREGRAVNDYLDALESHRPKRGRRVTPENLRERIRALNEEIIPKAVGADRLKAIQDRIDLEERLRHAEDTNVVADLEEAFKQVAKSYAERRGISYDAYREAGVPANVLKEAGVTRRSA